MFTNDPQHRKVVRAMYSNKELIRFVSIPECCHPEFITVCFAVLDAEAEHITIEGGVTCSQ